MTDEKNLISLKEAATISGYSSDYIGQLIRAGKIPGKQVYTNISWMTTATEVMKYKEKSEKNKGSNKGEKGFKSYLLGLKSRLSMEMNIFKLFFQTFKASIPVFIVAIVSFLLLATYVFYYFYSSSALLTSQNFNSNKQLEISF